jgi:hypothetical protein
VEGIGYPEILNPQPGKYRLRFPIVKPLLLGENIKWSYRRSYVRASGAQAPAENRVSIMSNDSGYGASLEVRFVTEPPPVIWSFLRNKLRYPGEPTPEHRLTLDDAGLVAFPETWETDGRSVYGIAWRYENIASL